MAKAQGPVQNLGAIGENVARNVRTIRDRMSYETLSKKLTALGRPIPVLGLSRIESNARRVDADDLVALAVALGVSPVRLLLPAEDVGEVPLTPTERASWAAAWAWATGERPLPASEHVAEVDAETFERDNAPHRARVGSRELVKWEEQLGALRDGLREATDAEVPASVIRAYVDFWTVVQASIRPTTNAIRRAVRKGNEGGDDGSR